MAGEHHRASSGLPQWGGVREEPGAVAAELEPRREPRGATGRKRPAAGHGLLRRLRPEDERSKPGSERPAIALLYLRAGLSGWRRKDLSKHDFPPRRCRPSRGIPDKRLTH